MTSHVNIMGYKIKNYKTIICNICKVILQINVICSIKMFIILHNIH